MSRCPFRLPDQRSQEWWASADWHVRGYARRVALFNEHNMRGVLMTDMSPLMTTALNVLCE
jgi:hypothetical protein